MTEFGADEIRDFTKLKRLREAGYFQSEGSVPMPEFTGPTEIEQLITKIKDMGMGGITREQVERRLEYWQSQVAQREAAHEALPHTRKYAQTNMFCTNCDRLTQHGQVATYENTGQPVFHCNFCCKCHLCVARLSGAQRLYEAVNDVGESLAATEVPDNPTTFPTFCSDCGAMLRCSVCESTGSGNYCQGCGKKNCGGSMHSWCPW